MLFVFCVVVHFSVSCMFCCVWKSRIVGLDYTLLFIPVNVFIDDLPFDGAFLVS